MRISPAIRLPVICAVLAWASWLACTAGAGQNAVVAGYVFPNGASLSPGEIDARGLTRINYAFANIKGGRVVPGNPQGAANLALLTSLRRQNPALQILLSVGGWTWSKNFSDAALTAASRQVFVDSAIALVDRYDLDGLDIDWEYPGQPGAGNVYRREDKQNFTLLIEQLRQRLDAAGKSLHRRLYLTIAAEASDEYLDKTEMDKVQGYVDAVNLMAYDFYIPGSDRITGNLAPLFTSAADPKQASADASVLAYEKAGVPAEKIVLGVPFYGYAWHGVADRNHGLFQRGKGGADTYLTYDAIVKTKLGHGFTRYWDGASSVPYLYDPGQRVFVTYEDPQSLALKCRYVLDHHLAGIIYWQNADDSTSALLRAIDRGLQGPAPAP